MTPSQPTHTQSVPQPAGAIADLQDELQRSLRGEVRFDNTTRMLYSTDASLYQINPIGVVLPKNLEDVQSVVSIAARRGVPILPRGGGSSLAGQAIGAALVLDFSKYMDKIIAIDSDARTVTTEPGVVLGVLNRQLAPLGWMVGPDPASAECSDVAAMVSMQADQLRRLITASSRDFDAQQWRGFGIPASLAQACGDDRTNK